MTKNVLNSGGSTFINFLRASASQLVLIGHLITWLKIFPFIQPPYIPYMQGVGVVLFFILSGFVIPYSTSIKVNDSNGYNFKEYFLDRFARIYSSFIPCLFIIVLLDYISIQISNSQYNYLNGFDLKTFLGNVFMLQDFPLNKYLHFEITSFGSGRPLWTLAIEWWIYFWFGFLYLVIIKQKKYNLMSSVFLVLFSIVPFFNFTRGEGEGLMLPWLLGVLVLLLLPTIKKLELKKIFIYFIIMILFYIIYKRFQLTQFRYVDAYYVCVLSVILLFLITLFNDVSFKDRTKKLINYFADYSFTLYLLHYSVIDLLINNFAKNINPYFLFIIAILSSNLIAIFVAHFTEKKYRVFREFLKAKFL